MRYSYTYIFFFSGVAINFLKNHPTQSTNPTEILFHINARPSNTVILNTFTEDVWQKEVVLKDDAFKEILFQRPFELSIRLLESSYEDGSEFEIFINGKFLTAFSSRTVLTEAKYLCFSPGLRIYGNFQDYQDFKSKL